MSIPNHSFGESIQIINIILKRVYNDIFLIIIDVLFIVFPYNLFISFPDSLIHNPVYLTHIFSYISLLSDLFIEIYLCSNFYSNPTLISLL